MFEPDFTIPVDKTTNSKKNPPGGSWKLEKGSSGKCKTGNYENREYSPQDTENTAEYIFTMKDAARHGRNQKNTP